MKTNLIYTIFFTLLFFCCKTELKTSINISNSEAVTFIFSFIDDAFEKMLNPIFRLLGLQSSSGPIDITLNQKNKSIELIIANNGKGKAKMAGIQVIDGNGKKSFPIPLSRTPSTSADPFSKAALCAND